jgi:predicted nucleic acid-binding protein
MTVINTSPAIHLNAVLPGGLELLTRLVGDVIMPYEVMQELAAGIVMDDTVLHAQSTSGLIIRQSPVQLSSWLKTEIDLGEAAVIQTAVDEGIGTVILDDLKARRVARRLGLAVTGTLGILLQAKASGYLPSINAVIQELQQRGMWLDEKVIATALQAAGESI